jgi:hypothetical protein
MATIHSSRTCLPKLCCSIAAVGLFITGILITGAYPHSNLNNRNYNRTNATTKETNLSSGDFTLTTERLAITQASNKPFTNTWTNKMAKIIRTQAPTKGVLSSKTSRRLLQQDWKPSKQTRTPYMHNWT